jgi:hypothetical protein
MDNGAIEVQSTSHGRFLVNGQRLKHNIPGDNMLMVEGESEDEEE